MGLGSPKPVGGIPTLPPANGTLPMTYEVSSVALFLYSVHKFATSQVSEIAFNYRHVRTRTYTCYPQVKMSRPTV